MNQVELTSFIKASIFNTPRCPDGANAISACVSCVAEFVAARLVDMGLVETYSSLVLDEVTMSDPSARVQGPTNERY